MKNEEIIQIVEKEFSNPSFAVTEQYLKIHAPVYLNGKLLIERIDRERKDNTIVAYLPVEKEKFFFAVYIENEEIISIGTEYDNQVYFRATSEVFTANDLSKLTLLNPTSFWNKGDIKRGSVQYKFSMIEFLPNPEPDEFEDKLCKLLDFLEQDKNGINQLVQSSYCYIQVAINFHNGNGMLGGFDINKEIIKKIYDLNLNLNFDLYASGNPFLNE